MNDVPVWVIRRTLTRENLPDLEFVNLCGNYGDPIYHPRFHEIVEHIKSEGFELRVESNGTHRKREWWEKTASLLDRGDRFTLSIDGLEDTNRLYRIRSDWNDILVAIHTLRGHVKLMWKFVVFRFNQHQIEEAKKLAAYLGFDDFKIIRSNRFGGKWAGVDGIDWLMPDPEWVSDRVTVAARIEEIRHGTQA